MRLKRDRRVGGEAGFTVVELLVYLVIAVVVIGGIYQVLISQNRLYSKQRELQDVRGTLRAAGNLLAFELRQASAANGDLYSANTSSFAVRSLQASAIVCGIHPNGRRFGLYSLYGDLTAVAGDSALLFAAGSTGIADDTWLTVGVDSLWLNGGGVPFCSWGDTATTATDAVIEVDTASVGPLTAVKVGAPIRIFRRTEYGLYQENGRWWLGRKVGNAASYEKLIGPMKAPADSGLALIYYDQAGSTTSTTTAVRMVDIIMRGESYGKAPTATGAPSEQGDSLTIRVSLRG